jgi:hypothetical protein
MCPASGDHNPHQPVPKVRTLCNPRTTVPGSAAASGGDILRGDMLNRFCCTRFGHMPAQVKFEVGFSLQQSQALHPHKFQPYFAL